jgi:hypothetical protein
MMEPRSALGSEQESALGSALGSEQESALGSEQE